jgi:hypothetical protein
MKRINYHVIGPNLNETGKIRADNLSAASGKIFAKFPGANTAILTRDKRSMEVTNPIVEARTKAEALQAEEEVAACVEEV